MAKPIKKGPPKRFPNHMATYVTDAMKARITHERNKLEISDAEVLRRALRQHFDINPQEDDQ